MSDDPKRMIEDLLDLGSLTKWEESFLTSISDKVDRNQQLSQREQEILDNIHKEKSR